MKARGSVWCFEARPEYSGNKRRQRQVIVVFEKTQDRNKGHLKCGVERRLTGGVASSILRGVDRESIVRALQAGAKSAAHNAVYLDWNATAPLRAEAFAVMRPFLEPSPRQQFGNAASLHRQGQAARVELERARRICAEVLQCTPEEIVFTSGGTEANNLALRGLAWAMRNSGENPRLIACALEHAAVHETLRGLEAQGFPTVLATTCEMGSADTLAFECALEKGTAVATLMLVNNETGVVQPVQAVAEAAQSRGVPFHVDAVQAAGKLSLQVAGLNCTTLALSAHKFEGPPGVGLLYVRRGTNLIPQITGGGQEGGWRGGTGNVAGAMGLAVALKLAESERMVTTSHLKNLRERFENQVKSTCPGAVIHGVLAPRVANTSFISFPGCDGTTLVQALDAEGISCSTGAACSEGVGKPSHVLTAMGVSAALGRAAVRFSLGRTTTEEHVRQASAVVARIVRRQCSNV